MNKQPRTLIIGAGPTGLGAAWRLNELGNENWLLCEKEAYFGGLATSFVDEHGFTWDFAIHVAHSHYHYFDNLMETLLPDGFYQHQRMAWVWEYGRFIPYPFQNNIRHLPKEYLWEAIQGILERPENAETNNFKDWILNTFGTGIGKHFLLPYNKKIWCTDAEDMGYKWTGDRVPTVDLERIIQNVIYEKDDVNWGPNAVFDFPKVGGTGAIWKAMGEALPQENIRLSTGVEKIDTNNKIATLSDGSTFEYDYIVSTIPLPMLTKLCNDEKADQLASQLRYTHVQVAGIAARQPMPEQLKGKTWLYCPEESSIFYRVTPFSEFSPAHTPDPENNCSFLCEIATAGDETMHDIDFKTVVLEDMKNSGLMELDPDKVHCHLMEAEFGYPVPTANRDELLNELMPLLLEKNIYSRGRFGGWKYEVANMDHSVMQGVEAIDHMLDGTEERTWPTPNVVNAGKS